MLRLTSDGTNRPNDKDLSLPSRSQKQNRKNAKSRWGIRNVTAIVRMLAWLAVVAAGISSVQKIRDVFVDNRGQDLSLELKNAIDVGEREMNRMNGRAKGLAKQYADIQSWENGWDLSTRLIECRGLVTKLLDSYGRMVPAADRDDLERARGRLKTATMHYREPRVEKDFRASLNENHERIQRAIDQWTPIAKATAAFIQTSKNFRDGTATLDTVRDAYDVFDKLFEARLGKLDHDSDAPDLYKDCGAIRVKCDELSNYRQSTRWPILSIALGIGLVVGVVLLSSFAAGWIPPVPKDK